MRSFPTVPYTSEIKVFADLLQSEKFFHLFAQELILKNLRDSSGTNAPIDIPEVITMMVAETPVQTLNLEFKTQMIMPFHLTFPKGAKYRLRVLDAAGVKVSARQVGAASFGTVPTEITTECDSEYSLEVLATATRAEPMGAKIKIQIERGPQEECQCQVDRPISDSCIIGKWEIVHPRVEDHLRRMLEMGPMTVERVESTGNFTVEITPEGRTIWTAAPWEVFIRTQQRGGEIMDMRTVNEGQFISKVSNGNGILCNSGLSTTMRATMYMTVRGQTQTKPTNPTVNGIPHRFTYKCDGDILDYMEAIGVGPGGSNMRFDYQLKRIR